MVRARNQLANLGGPECQDGRNFVSDPLLWVRLSYLIRMKVSKTVRTAQ